MHADTGQIVLTDVSKNYGGPPVLEHTNLAVPAGEALVIMGRSGSGKSTLLKLIGGLDTPDAGEVRFGGRDLSRMTERERTRFRRRSLGFVFQFFNLLPTLTISENIMIPLSLNGFAAGSADHRIAELLEELGLVDCGDRFPEELSGGEQQRAAIARALVHSPDLVVADEPTGNLDLETARQVLELLRRSCSERNTTLVMATHSREAAGIADRILEIHAGRLE